MWGAIVGATGQQSQRWMPTAIATGKGTVPFTPPSVELPPQPFVELLPPPPVELLLQPASAPAPCAVAGKPLGTKPADVPCALARATQPPGGHTAWTRSIQRNDISPSNSCEGCGQDDA